LSEDGKGIEGLSSEINSIQMEMLVKENRKINKIRVP